MKLITTLILLVLFVGACSLPPDVPVTRKQLMGSGIYRTYVIEESPEEVLDAVNLDGEVMLKAHRKIGKKRYPVWVKVLATPKGLDVGDYDR